MSQFEYVKNRAVCSNVLLFHQHRRGLSPLGPGHRSDLPPRLPLILATCTETQLSAGGEGQRGQHALTSSTHAPSIRLVIIGVVLIVVALISSALVRALVSFSIQSPEGHRGGTVHGYYLLGIFSLYLLRFSLEFA